MPGPFPVIGIAAELAHAFRRGAYQAYIAIPLIDEYQELIAFEQRADLADHAFSRVGIAAIDGGDHALRFSGAIRPTQSLQGIFHLRGDVFYLQQEVDIQPPGGDLFFLVPGIESVMEIVMLDGTGRGDRLISAVMIGKDQSLAADDLAGAAPAENNDGVLDGSLIDAIELRRGELKPLFHHIVID